jgi:hypothetical protein
MSKNWAKEICQASDPFIWNLYQTGQKQMNPAYFETRFRRNDSEDSWPQDGHIITAYNPMDLELSEIENRLRNQKLKEQIRLSGFDCIEITGVSIDLTHQEPSFFTNASRKKSLFWGRAFEQRAIFGITQDKLSIIPCLQGEQPIYIGTFQDRLI